MKIGSCLELDSRKVMEQYKAKMLATMTKGKLPYMIIRNMTSKCDLEIMTFSDFELRYEV